MIFFKTLISLSIFALFSCTVPQTRTVTRSFNYSQLTVEMLDDTAWCGQVTKFMFKKNKNEEFMAIYFKDGQATVARASSQEQAVQKAKHKFNQRAKLHHQIQPYTTNQNKVTVLGLWDESRYLGFTSAYIEYSNNGTANFKLYDYYAKKKNTFLAFEAQNITLSNF